MHRTSYHTIFGHCMPIYLAILTLHLWDGFPFFKKKLWDDFWCAPLRRKKCLSLQRLIVTVSKTIAVIKSLLKSILVMIIVLNLWLMIWAPPRSHIYINTPLLSLASHLIDQHLPKLARAAMARQKVNLQNITNKLFF